MINMDLELLSFIKRSGQRVKILMNFRSSHTPSEITKKCGLSPSHTSRTLKEFCEKGILKCENPKDHTGRIYSLTEKGEELQGIIEGADVADKYSK